MLTLHDIREALCARAKVVDGTPSHIGAFTGWIVGDIESLRGCVHQAYAFDGQARRPEHVAALGYGAAAGLLDDREIATLADEVTHLAGRDFFAHGRPLRFEADGIGLLGVALGAAATSTGGEWLSTLLARACGVAGDVWQQELIRAARLAISETGLKIAPPDLAVALASKGIGVLQESDLEPAWLSTSTLMPHAEGTPRDAVRLAVFNHIVARQGQIRIGAATKADLAELLRNVGRSLKLWQYEDKGRTPRSAPGRWEIENEYHVQALLWTVLAPVFSDLEDEENLPSVGHKHPRADLGIPSLRTIVEVKFMRNSGQRACAEVVEQVAADASLYLSKPGAYDDIIAVVWDECAQTEQHHELRTGLESLRGVSTAVIISRPAKMKRSQ
jgi:hypothetical protein